LEWIVRRRKIIGVTQSCMGAIVAGIILSPFGLNMCHLFDTVRGRDELLVFVVKIGLLWIVW
jgi:hypothetical protein